MFKDFINQNVLVYLKSEENENYWSSSIDCVLLDYDTRFLKLSLNGEIHYINIDFVRDVTLKK